MPRPRFGKVQPVTGDIGDAQAKEKLESIVNNKNNELNKAAEEAVAGLNNLDEQEKSSIPAGYFKSNFADSFQDMIEKNAADETVVRDWLKIAGGGHREVTLTNDVGEIVDIVPPIFGKTPPLNEADNTMAKEMTQAMLLTGEEGDSFHPLLDLENDKQEYLSAIGHKLGEGILSDEENAKNSIAFKTVVSKYSNKLSEEDISTITKDDNVKKNENIEFIID